MASYDYVCKECGTVEEHVHGMNETPEIKCTCGGAMEKIFSPNIGGFILKGGTPAIHFREKQQRHKKSEEMAQRQKNRYGDNPGPKLKPNIAGHETGTWENAHEIAKEIAPQTGINTASYEARAKKEGSKKIIVAQS
jgi:putative FmdB family regulatory protein